MIKIFRCLIFSALFGSLVSPAAAQLFNPPTTPVNAPKTLVPAPLAKECAAKFMADKPRARIVGPFGRAQFATTLGNWVAEKAGVVVIAAPATWPFKPMFSAEERMAKNYAGCIFDTRDGAYVFRRLIQSNEFPITTTIPPNRK